MPLTPGTRLGSYEITAQIGVGGMGEVYRATDRNLGRDVAIKVLPEAFAQDAERLARFEREARTLASLNHPNIAIIHGLERGEGVRALVMELVEGSTLADRLAGARFTSDETGQNEVYVAPFPGPGGRWPISTTGGRFPRWRRDGKEIFFQVQGGIAASEVSGDKGVFSVGQTRTLLRGAMGVGARRLWDVAPDGQHFVLALENSEDEIVPITLVVNWMAVVK